jgi:tRNA pseudouridine55 synthase
VSRRRSRGRRDEVLQGLLLVDKPAGFTSHDVCQAVKGRLRLGKVGHGGTLDPFATGLLPLMLNGATKLMPLLSGKDKTYRAVVRFGWATDTLDPTGERVAEGDPSGLDRAALEAAVAGFVGPITQVIPSYSAKKVEGKRLYEYAREGAEIELPTKDVTIHGIEVLGFSTDEHVDLDLRVSCSSGTYIRTLADDLGRAVGVPAHLAELRRETTGPFRLNDAVPLQAILDEADADRAVREAAKEAGEGTRFDPQANAAKWSAFVGAALRPVAELIDAPVVRPEAEVGARFHNGQPLRKEDLAAIVGLPERWVPGDRLVVEDAGGSRALGVARARQGSGALDRLVDRGVVFEVERILR